MKGYRISIVSFLVFLFLSAIFHSLSFFAKPEPANDSERQLLDLMNNYQMDMGAGFVRTFHEIFLSVSACFTLICLFGGILLFYLFKCNLTKQVMTGVLNIYCFIFGIAFIVMLVFTFLPPIVCIGFVFISLISTRYFSKDIV
ncbi:MAG: hypothetical protein IPL31_03590 [Saprospiraceae bacterium]|nr:hypothetical protein [Saprospiraceae bacterium]